MSHTSPEPSHRYRPRTHAPSSTCGFGDTAATEVTPDGGPSASAAECPTASLTALSVCGREPKRMLTPQAIGNTMPCPYCNGSRPELRMDGMNVKPARVRATRAFRPAHLSKILTYRAIHPDSPAPRLRLNRPISIA